MRKAEQFLRGARDLDALSEEPDDNNDAVVSLYVLAGIAAADVICCRKLGAYATGQSHAEAASLLELADADPAKHLRRLLDLKSKAGYTSTAVAAEDLRTSERAALKLLERARLA